MTELALRRLWLPDHGGRIEAATVSIASDGTVLALTPGLSPGAPVIDDLVIPGVVNAHTHLELDALPTLRAPTFLDWLADLRHHLPAPDPGPRAAHDLAALGCAWVGDVSNGGHTGDWLVAAGLRGVVHHERLGTDPEIVAGLLATPVAEHAVGPGVTRWPTAHALFSTAPAAVAHLLAGRDGRPPACLHLGESVDEAEFLRDASGRHADLLDALGRDWRGGHRRAPRPVASLEALGVLGPGLLAVHGVFLDAEDREDFARTGARLCLCPRSNLNVTGRLPNVPAWLAAGVPLALGTDSRASAESLDVLAEIPVLAAAFPEVDAGVWLALATHAGAAAAGANGVGAVRVGERPGLWRLAAHDPRALCQRPPDRVQIA
ncbi:MAG: hypothetical protein RLZZ383_2224 [Pseudomonadota bacterium]